jgi:hypothetical protein
MDLFLPETIDHHETKVYASFSFSYAASAQLLPKREDRTLLPG